MWKREEKTTPANGPRTDLVLPNGIIDEKKDVKVVAVGGGGPTRATGPLANTMQNHEKLFDF
jgi:hypothetical protein